MFGVKKISFLLVQKSYEDAEVKLKVDTGFITETDDGVWKC